MRNSQFFIGNYILLNETYFFSDFSAQIDIFYLQSCFFFVRSKHDNFNEFLIKTIKNMMLWRALIPIETLFFRLSIRFCFFRLFVCLFVSFRLSSSVCLFVFLSTCNREYCTQNNWTSSIVILILQYFV